ncbi:Rv3235 family protein [Nocardia alba]|uniref:Rv3235 family protein n=1 Tax=Nocardia alba TaxID=225051 RepID=UPI0012EE7EED|nr:Rv3235 family protein [Nocardia alba]
MSTEAMVLSPAPHCEPRLEGGEVVQRGADVNTAVPHRVTGSGRPRAAGGAPASIRRVVRASCPQAVPAVESLATAQRFAEQVLRLLLEVVDRRRSPTHLRAYTDARALAAINTMLAQDLVPGRGLGSATLTRVKLTPAPDGAEVFASYQRGPRTLAVAGRIESLRDGWRLVAVRMY